jgi:hypothetical protein
MPKLNSRFLELTFSGISLLSLHLMSNGHELEYASIVHQAHEHQSWTKHHACFFETTPNISSYEQAHPYPANDIPHR